MSPRYYSKRKNEEIYNLYTFLSNYAHSCVLTYLKTTTVLIQTTSSDKHEATFIIFLYAWLPNANAVKQMTYIKNDLHSPFSPVVIVLSLQTQLNYPKYE